MKATYYIDNGVELFGHNDVYWAVILIKHKDLEPQGLVTKECKSEKTSERKALRVLKDLGITNFKRVNGLLKL